MKPRHRFGRCCPDPSRRSQGTTMAIRYVCPHCGRDLNPLSLIPVMKKTMICPGCRRTVLRTPASIAQQWGMCFYLWSLVPIFLVVLLLGVIRTSDTMGWLCGSGGLSLAIALIPGALGWAIGHFVGGSLKE